MHFLATAVRGAVAAPRTVVAAPVAAAAAAACGSSQM